MASTKPLSRPKRYKRKIFTIFLYFLFITFGFIQEAASQFNCDSLQCIKGDLNRDSILTLADVVFHLNCVFMDADSCDICLVDVNCNGIGDPVDIVTELYAVFLNSPIDNIRYPVIVDADTSIISDSLRQVYWGDAEQLAIRALNSAGFCAKKRAVLPANLIRSIFNALIHVYNDTGLAARDSIVSMYCIHTFKCPINRRVLVYADTSYAWVQAWRRGERFTGNPQIDVLMECFNLNLVYFKIWPGWIFGYARLQSEMPVNPEAVAEKFRGIEGVRYGETDCYGGDGNDITLEIEENLLQLNYSVGYGDCPAGCPYRRFWTFRVYSDGRVEYIGSRGDPAPDPSNFFCRFTF